MTDETIETARKGEARRYVVKTDFGYFVERDDRGSSQWAKSQRAVLRMSGYEAHNVAGMHDDLGARVVRLVPKRGGS